MAFFLEKFWGAFLAYYQLIAALVVLVVGIIEAVLGVFNELVFLVGDLVGRSLNIDPASFGGFGEYAAVANHIFPLTEFLAMGTAYFGVYSALIVVRWVKSFIPTVAN